MNILEIKTQDKIVVMSSFKALVYSIGLKWTKLDIENIRIEDNKIYMLNNNNRITIDITSKMGLNHYCDQSSMTYKFVLNDEYCIEFDEYSYSAAHIFYDTIHKIMGSDYQIIKYDSGNIRYMGETLNDKPHGENIFEYFDKADKIIKYRGDFENGIYDGAGTFHSFRGDVRISFNNICNGVPNGKGKIYCYNRETHEIDYDELNEKYSFEPSSKNFVYDILLIVQPNYIKYLDDILFEQQTVEVKLNIIHQQLKHIGKEMIELEKQTKVKSSKKLVICTMIASSFIAFVTSYVMI